MFSRIPLRLPLEGWHCGSVDSALNLSGCGLHCAIRSSGAEQTRDGLIHQAPSGKRKATS